MELKKKKERKKEIRSGVSCERPEISVWYNEDGNRV